MRCSALKKEDGTFAPAHLLADSRLERAGRASKDLDIGGPPVSGLLLLVMQGHGAIAQPSKSEATCGHDAQCQCPLPAMAELISSDIMQRLMLQTLSLSAST